MQLVLMTDPIYKDMTYVDGEVQQIKRARVRLVVPFVTTRGPLDHRGGGGHGGGVHLDGEAPARQHRHEDVGDVHQDGPKHLLRSIKEPNLDRSLRPLSPAFVHERHEGQATEGKLHEQCKGPQQAALAIVVIIVLGGRGGGGLGGLCGGG